MANGGREQLFNLLADPHELYNRIDAMPEIASEILSGAVGVRDFWAFHEKSSVRKARNLKAASVSDYTMYSGGMKKLGEQGLVWNEQNIDKWIADPKAMIPDSPMALAFQGIPDAGERTDIIAYLKTIPAQ